MKELTSLTGRPFWLGLLTLSLTSAGLLPCTASAQQYQETNLVANSSQSGATTVDPDLVKPWGVPFNIQDIGGNLYVAFAKQNAAKNFVDFGADLGTVDVFSPEGDLLVRLQRGPWFNAPWGLVQASTDFGTFSHSIVVGQFGSGEILAFDVVTGQFQGKLEHQKSNPISIPGLWALAFGAGNTNSGAQNQLFFSAGIDQGKGGLFGFFAPVAADLIQGNDR